MTNSNLSTSTRPRRIRLGLGSLVVAVLAVLSLTPVASPVAAELSPQIVDGSVAAITDAPWQVSLTHVLKLNGQPQTNDYAGNFCGGAVLTASWIITAAHCIVGETAASFTVVYGTATLPNDRRIGHAVDRVVVHPQYDDNLINNDIALVHLAQSIPAGTPNVMSLTLPTVKPSAGVTARISGWGSTARVDPPTEPPANSYPSVLRKATITIDSDAECTSKLPYDFRSSTMLCAGTMGASKYTNDTCYGDSGGALAMNRSGSWQVAGIVSWGEGCAWLKPGMYTNVANYVAWIRGIAPGAQLGFTTAMAPRIRGAATARRGVALSVDPGVWSPSPTLTYQWRSNGVVVGSAATYVPTSTDVGRRITVTMTATKAYYRTVSFTSPATVAVAS